MINLASGQCVAPRAGEPTLTDAEIEDLLLHVHQWQVKEVGGMKRLEKSETVARLSKKVCAKLGM